MGRRRNCPRNKAPFGEMIERVDVSDDQQRLPGSKCKNFHL